MKGEMNMVEMTERRFAELIRIEERFTLLKEAARTLPAYKLDETILLLLGESGKEVDANAE